jgi:type II secretory pathway component PulF
VPVYNYQGERTNGSSAKGTITADTPRQARDLLRTQGISVRKLSDTAVQSTSKRWFTFGTRSLQTQWTGATHELAMLLHAGIPLLDGLDTIARQQTGAFQTILLGVRDRVAGGAGFAEALADRPDVFDAASIHLVEVGENAGNLEHVLEQLANFKLQMMETKDQVMTTLIYPAFLVVFGSGASIFLMTYVMPPLLENLMDTLKELPWPTRVVKGISDLLLNYGLLLAVTLIAMVVAIVAYIRTDSGQLAWHRSLLRLPLIGPMMAKQGVSRIAMIVGTLLRSGIVLTSAFDLAAKSTDNRVLRDALKECGKRMGAGEDVAEALERSGVFPPLAVRVFAVGQESGRLEEMLERLARDYDRQVSIAAKRFTALLEPVLIVVMAVFVGFLLFATILPILEAGRAVQN